jgi:MFS family permease
MVVTAATGSIYVVIGARFLSALVRTPPWLYLQVMSVGSYPPEQRGRVLGITRLAHGAAIVTGVPLAGWMVDQWGWRWLFLGTAVLWAGLLLAVWRMVPRDQRAPAAAGAPVGLAAIDVLGGVLLMAGVVGLVTALQTFARGQASALGIAAGGIGLLALVAFVRQERRAAAPMLHQPQFGLRQIFVSAAQALFLGFVNGVVVLLLPFLFIRGYGWTAALAGGMLFFLNLPRPLAGLLGGWLADRIGSGRTIVPAALSMVVGQVLAASLGVEPLLPLLAGALMLMGMGDALASTANLRQIFSAMPRAYLPLAPSTNLVLSLLGATFGQAFVAAALEVAGVPRTGSDSMLVGIAAVVLLTTSVLFVGGMIVAQLVPRIVPAVGREALDSA